MSSSASPDDGTIPSKEFRKRQVSYYESYMEYPFWNGACFNICMNHMNLFIFSLDQIIRPYKSAVT